MTTVDKHEPGTFCWVELSTTDIAQGRAFYESLFGWKGAVQPAGDVGEYVVFSVADGRPAAGGYEQPEQERSMGLPPHWNLYIYSDDVDSSSPAYADRIPLAEWGFDGRLIQTGSNLEFPDTDRANLLIHGTTISHAWDVRSGPPPITYEQPFSLSDPAKFSLNGPGGWTAVYWEVFASASLPTTVSCREWASRS